MKNYINALKIFLNKKLVRRIIGYIVLSNIVPIFMIFYHYNSTEMPHFGFYIVGLIITMLSIIGIFLIHYFFKFIAWCFIDKK